MSTVNESTAVAGRATQTLATITDDNVTAFIFRPPLNRSKDPMFGASKRIRSVVALASTHQADILPAMSEVVKHQGSTNSCPQGNRI